MIDIIKKYFPSLSDLQIGQFELLMTLYPDWNAKINVISRKDIDNLEVNHILHSLAIAKFLNFAAGSSVLDFGTGGGFPESRSLSFSLRCASILSTVSAKNSKWLPT